MDPCILSMIGIPPLLFMAYDSRNCKVRPSSSKWEFYSFSLPALLRNRLSSFWPFVPSQIINFSLLDHVTWIQSDHYYQCQTFISHSFSLNYEIERALNRIFLLFWETLIFLKDSNTLSSSPSSWKRDSIISSGWLFRCNNLL